MKNLNKKLSGMLLFFGSAAAGFSALDYYLDYRDIYTKLPSSERSMFNSEYRKAYSNAGISTLLGSLSLGFAGLGYRHLSARTDDKE